MTILIGVQQKTVRQQSTMDNAGTLPIFQYGNSGVDNYELVDIQHPIATPVFEDNQDDIPLASNNPSTSKAGRKTSATEWVIFV